MAKVLLIGLDGATFTLLDPYMQRGLMPFLRDFASGGVRATLQTVKPALTPPGWTSLMTGKRPGQHGVFDFFQKDAPDSHYLQLTDSRNIGSETIWSLASQNGQRVIGLNFPLTFPAPPVNGCFVPGGWVPWRQLRLACYPPDLFDRLKTLPGFNARELALDMAAEVKAVEGCADEEYAQWVQLHIRREQRWLEVCRYLMHEERADLVGVVFDGVDKLQHLCWRFLDPALRSTDPSAWEQETIQLCESYFRQLDGIVAELVQLAGPGATVVFASDHGAGPATEVFYVNTWLEQLGLLAWSDQGAQPVAASAKLGFEHIARHVFELDWERTFAYASTPSSQGIHIATRRPDSEWRMSAEEYGRVRDRVVEALASLRHPVTGEPLIAEVGTREDVFGGPYEALAPDVFFTLRDGAAVSILRGSDLVARRTPAGGNHRPEGVFLAAGPGLKAGQDLGHVSITDIAPLVLYRLGIPVPVDLAGRVPVAAIETAELRRRPVAYASGPAPLPQAVQSAPEPQATEIDSEAEEIVLRRLRALGYVE